MLNEELIDCMVFNALSAIVDSYTDSHSYEYNEDELASIIRDELEFSEQELAGAADEVWEEAKDNTCYGNGEYWHEAFEVTPLATEMLLNEPDMKESVINRLKELCL